MKRVLLTIAVALLIPSILAAAPITIGVYYEGSHACVPPAPGVPFTVSLYMVQGEYNVTAIEYALEMLDAVGGPSGVISIQGWTLPGGSETELGNPIDGHSVAYWPPLNGFPVGYDLLVNYSIVTFAPCEQMTDHHINVVPHPDTGLLRCTTAPDGDKVEMVGLTLWFCPSEVGTQESSWGAIKGQYR
jgi:hypothetical protein